MFQNLLKKIVAKNVAFSLGYFTFTKKLAKSSLIDKKLPTLVTLFTTLLTMKLNIIELVNCDTQHNDLLSVSFYCYAEYLYVMLIAIVPMEQHTLINVKNCLNTNIYSYFETFGGQCSNLY
jgi:hypothetical protein